MKQRVPCSFGIASELSGQQPDMLLIIFYHGCGLCFQNMHMQANHFLWLNAEFLSIPAFYFCLHERDVKSVISSKSCMPIPGMIITIFRLIRIILDTCCVLKSISFSVLYLTIHMPPLHPFPPLIVVYKKSTRFIVLTGRRNFWLYLVKAV